MIDCKFADPIRQSENREITDPKTGKSFQVRAGTLCHKLSDEAGFTIGLSKLHCDICDGRVTIGGSGSGKSCAESTLLSQWFKNALRGRLIAGDAERYPDEVNLSEAFTKYRVVTSDGEAEDLLAEMLDAQLQMAQSGVAGCHSEAVVRDKIAALAEENGFVTPTEAEAIRRE